MIIVVTWWFWMQVMGLAALPLTHRFFARLPGRGYVFARPLGLLLCSYVLWLGSSLGVLRNSVGGALLSIAVVAAVSLAVYRRGHRGADGEENPGLLAWLRANPRLVVAVELLFGGGLALWSVLRAYSPEIMTAGGEKFMEIMYLNAIGRSEYFPPHDAWLAGYGISYYYFGYVMMATLTRLSGFAAHLTFNVGLASLFALTCTGAFGLVYELVRSSGQAGAGAVSRGSKPVGWGLLGAVLVAVMGNLEGFLEVLYSARLLPLAFWQWLDIEELNQPFPLGAPASLLPTRSGWWWWRASRVIRDLDPLGQPMAVQPIDEFPGFSFLLGDMHPHVLALPFVLLALALAFWALRQGAAGAGTGTASSTGDPAGKEPWWQPARRLPLLVPLCLGGLAFLNTWDFPIYWLLFVIAYGLGRWRQYGTMGRALLGDVALTGATAAVLGFVLYLPFYIGFQSQAGGLLPTLYVGTRFRQYFVMFGPFLVTLAGLLLFLAHHQVRSGREELTHLGRRCAAWTAAFLLLPLALMVVLVLGLLLTGSGRQALEGIRHIPAVYAIVGDSPWPAVLAQLIVVKLRTWVMPLVVGAMAALGTAVLHSRFRARSRPVAFPSPILSGPGEEGSVGLEVAGAAISAPPADPVELAQENGSAAHDALHFALLCAVAGLLLTLSVEFVYLVDNFGVRMNTIFKFYFQAWVLMAVASAFAAYWLHLGSGAVKRGAAATVRTGFLVAFWLLFAMGMVYPVLGNYSRARGFENPPTLDGTAYLAHSQPDDHAAIAWLNDNVEGAPIILETPGGGASSYVYEGRVSALTGLPTLLGWAGHEGQWRGSYEIQGAREPAILTIYSTLDPRAAETLLRDYGVTYVYVGPLERSKYDPRALDKFERFMDIVYQETDVTIYKLSQ
jgi:YYY domain-containing protein